MDPLTLSTIAFVLGVLIGAVLQYLMGKLKLKTPRDEWTLSAEAQRELDRHFCGRR